MADTIYCLDITENRLVGVVVENNSGSRVTVVKACIAVDIKEQSFDEAIRELKEHIGVVAGRCLVTLTAEHFSYRNLTLPFTDRKKIDQVLPFELIDLSPVDVSSLTVDCIVASTAAQKADLIAAMIDKVLLEKRLSSLIEAGFDPDRVGISGIDFALQIAEEGLERFVLIDFDTRWTRLFVVVNGKVSLIRSLVSPLRSGKRSSNVVSFAQTVKQTLLTSKALRISDPDYPVYLTGCESLRKVVALVLPTVLEGGHVETYQQSGRPLIKIAPEIVSSYQPDLMDKALALGLTAKGAQGTSGLNFRKGLLKKKTSLSEYRLLFLKVAAPFALVLVLVTGYLVSGYFSMVSTRERLDRQVMSVFRETLPEVTRIVNPVQQLQVANNEIKATFSGGGEGGSGYTVIDLLTELSSRIPVSYIVKIVRLVADGDTVRIKGVTGDFNTVDNIQKELGKSPYFNNVTISSANQSSKGNGVGFELKLELARK